MPVKLRYSMRPQTFPCETLRPFFFSPQKQKLKTRTKPKMTDIKLAPREYQDFAAFWLARRGGGILGDEVGLGKSFSFSLTCQTLKAQRVLLIVPKRLKPQWATELQRYEPGEVIVRDLDTYIIVEVYNPTLTRVYYLAHYEQFQFDADNKTPKAITES